MLNLFAKSQWAIIDCLTGERYRIDQLPFEIGSGAASDLKLSGQSVAERHATLNEVRDGGFCLIRQHADFPMEVNGESVELVALSADTDYAIRIGHHLLALHGGKQVETWLANLDVHQWTLHDSVNNRVDGPMEFEALCQFAKAQQRHPRTVLQPAGFTKGFFLNDALELLASRKTAAEAGKVVDTPMPLQEEVILTCPVCWLKFDLGDVMHLATHESLRGDPVLGEDAPQRFLATRFNDQGQALDALGLACPDIACPHCRRVLPPGFIEMTHYIISIVGDQSAGKSYYLSVLLEMLPASLFSNFGVVFQDADPVGNALINEMRQTLFGAKTPEGARLAKTQLEGGMYVRLPRHGRMVALPKPFIFSAASAKNDAHRCSVIFYDNAGEHFQPGRDSMDSPGAQHVASSSGLIFLFDPFNNPEFRREIADNGDPQLEKPVMDQQGVILSEMKVRMSRLLKTDLVDHVDTPMAVLIGKCDTWLTLLGPDALRPTIANGKLDIDAVIYNSVLVRTLMMRLSPSIVANAESISRNVMYFPVSSFGHSPVRLGQGDYVPDPRQLKPFQVEVPILWILSCIEPKLVPR